MDLLIRHTSSEREVSETPLPLTYFSFLFRHTTLNRSRYFLQEGPPVRPGPPLLLKVNQIVELLELMSGV